MATGTFTLYASALKEFADGTQDWDSDSHYGVLLTNAYTPSLAHSVLSNVSGSEGAIPRGDFSGEAVFVFNDIAYCTAATTTFSTNATGTVKYLVIVQGTKSASLPSDKLVGYMDLNTSGDITVANEVFDIGWDGDLGIFAIGNGNQRITQLQTTSYGLSHRQFFNEDLFLAIRAHPDQVIKRNTSNADDVTGAPDTPIADGNILDGVYDASPYQWTVRQQTASTNDPEWDTNAAGFENGSILWNSTGPGFEVKRSRYSIRFLNDNTSDFTIIWRGAINEALTNTGTLLRSYTGATNGFVFNYGINTGADDLGFGVHDGTSFDSIDYTTWSGFTQGQVYTIVVRHTSDGVTEIYIDDLDIPVASGTLTTWESTLTNDNIWISEDPSGTNDAQINLQGVVIAKKNLSNFEIENYVKWMRGTDTYYSDTDFATLTELHDAIDEGFTGNWTVKWSGDQYVQDGELRGVVRDGSPFPHPFFQGVEFPSWLLALSEWTFPGNTFGAADADGRPICTATQTGYTDIPVLDPRWNFGAFRQLNVRMEHTLNGETSDQCRYGIRFHNILDPDDRVQNYWKTSGGAGTSHNNNMQVYDNGGSSTTFDGLISRSDVFDAYLTTSVENYYDNTPDFTGRSWAVGSPDYSTMTRTLGHTGWLDGGTYSYQLAMVMTAPDTDSELRLISIGGGEGVTMRSSYTTITELSKLPSNPVEDDIVEYSPGVGTAILRYDGTDWVLMTTFGNRVEIPFAFGSTYNSAAFTDIIRTEDSLTASAGSITVDVTTGTNYVVEPVFKMNGGVLGIQMDANSSPTTDTSFGHCGVGYAELRQIINPDYGWVSKFEISTTAYNLVQQLYGSGFEANLSINSTTNTETCELYIRARDKMFLQWASSYDADMLARELTGTSNYITNQRAESAGGADYFLGCGFSGTVTGTISFNLHFMFVQKDSYG